MSFTNKKSKHVWLDRPLNPKSTGWPKWWLKSLPLAALTFVSALGLGLLLHDVQVTEGAAPHSSVISNLGPNDTPTVTNTATDTPKSPSPTDTPIGTPVLCLQELQDVPLGHPDYNYIHCVMCQGSMDNYPCGQPSEPCVPPDNNPYFRPSDLYAGTRAEVCKLIVVAAGWPFDTSGAFYSDVPPTHPYFNYILTARNRGIITGFGNLFRPNDPLARGQFSKVLYLALIMHDTIVSSLTPTATPSPCPIDFSDVRPSDYFYVPVQYLYCRGIMDGYPDGTFLPYNNLSTMTRVEIARIAARAFTNCGDFTPLPTATGTPPTATYTPSRTQTSTVTFTVTPVITSTCVAAWRVLNSPDLLPNEARLYTFSAVSANDVWAVGIRNTSTAYRQSLIERWDGIQWSVVPSPNPSSNYTELSSIAAISANDVWAVGFYVTYNPNNSFTLIEHWNGTAWSVIPSPNFTSAPNYLLDVSAKSANDVWAVGHSYSSSGFKQTLALHWDGVRWRVVSTPNSSTGNNTLNAVSVVSANDVWAAGYYETGTGTRELSLTMHWDGSAWSLVPSPNRANAYRTELYGMTAISANDVWVIGSYYDSNASVDYTLSMHWDGTVWSIIPTPNRSYPEAFNYLYDISAYSSNDVWAVGYMNDYGSFYALVEHWNGTVWSIVYTSSAVREVGFGGVVAISPNNAWAGGYYKYNDGQHNYDRPIIERYNDPCAPFTDVNPTDYFYASVQYLYSRGVISGYGTEFRPYNNTSRGQLCKIVTLGFNLPINTTGGPHFTDVATSSVFYPYVETAYNRGIVNGYGTEFRPNDNVTRGQLCKIVVLAARWSINTTGGPHFTDVAVGSTFYTYIETGYNRGIISGYASLFKPNNTATRGQICKIVYLAVTQQ